MRFANVSDFNKESMNIDLNMIFQLGRRHAKVETFSIWRVDLSQVLLDLHGLPGSQNGEIHSGVTRSRSFCFRLWTKFLSWKTNFG